MNVDQLELELRKLPGICWVAFNELGDWLVVQLHAIQDAHDDLALEASQIAARHCDVPVAIDLVRWMTPPATDRAGLENATLQSNGSSALARVGVREPRFEVLSVLTVVDADEVEVHLGDGRTRTIGRAAVAHGLLGAVEATLKAIREFPVDLKVEAEWARAIEMTSTGRPIVAVAFVPAGGEEFYGVSRADTEMEAAARATVEALGQHLHDARPAETP
jgi:hypothetical protein